MSLYFITGNAGKLAELQAIIPEVEGIELDLPEIQEVDAQKIIEAKLQEALKIRSGPFIVEDTSLYMEALNGLPGPLIKWFIAKLGLEGLADVASRLGNAKAHATTIIGYADEDGGLHYFTGDIPGTIVAPRGDNGFGWNPIFQPEGYDVTFAEMSHEQKYSISMRRLAAEKLKVFLAEKP